MKNNFLISFILVLTLLTSCSTEDDKSLQSKESLKENLDFQKRESRYKFDYTLYNEFRNNIINTVTEIKLAQPSQSIEGLQEVLNIVNTNHNSDLTLNQLDYHLFESQEERWEDFYLRNGYLTNEEVNLIGTFSTDARNLGFDFALENLKSNILRLDLNEDKFKNYNYLVNTLMISNDYFELQNQNLRRPSWWGAAGCGVAIAANAVSTYALTACVVPNPTSPGACATAAVGKVLGMAGVLFGCF